MKDETGRATDTVHELEGRSGGAAASVGLERERERGRREAVDHGAAAG